MKTNKPAEEKVKPEYKSRAKFFVDSLFDNGLLNKDLSRDGLNALEEIVAYEYQSSADSNQRLLEFTSKMEKWKKNVKTK